MGSGRGGRGIYSSGEEPEEEEQEEEEIEVRWETEDLIQESTEFLMELISKDGAVLGHKDALKSYYEDIKSYLGEGNRRRYMRVISMSRIQIKELTRIVRKEIKVVLELLDERKEGEVAEDERIWNSRKQGLMEEMEGIEDRIGRKIEGILGKWETRMRDVVREEMKAILNDRVRHRRGVWERAW